MLISRRGSLSFYGFDFGAKWFKPRVDYYLSCYSYTVDSQHTWCYYRCKTNRYMLWKKVDRRSWLEHYRFAFFCLCLWFKFHSCDCMFFGVLVFPLLWLCWTLYNHTREYLRSRKRFGIRAWGSVRAYRIHYNIINHRIPTERWLVYRSNILYCRNFDWSWSRVVVSEGN